jgi:hypothetical protein
MVAALPLLVAIALGISGAAAAGTGGVAPIERDAGAQSTIDMTVSNWGRQVTTLDPDNRVWGHVFEAGAGADAVTTLTVTIDAAGGEFRGYVAHLSAPDLYFDHDQFCSDENHIITSTVTCSFTLALVAGANRLDFFFRAGGTEAGIEAHGIVYGGDPGQLTAFEVQGADGWRLVNNGGSVALPAMQRSAVQFVVVNTGTVPLGLPDTCLRPMVLPGSQVVCPVRSARPGHALGGDYRLPVRIVDPTGASIDLVLAMHVAVPGVRT